MRINVSTGPKPVAVPTVVGLDYSTALQQLQSAGFTVARTDVESDQPAGEVVDQGPTGNSTASKGSSVTLSVSKGPTTAGAGRHLARPQADARATLKAAGFKVNVDDQDTDDETLDGLVMSQDPGGNTPAGSEVGRDALRRDSTSAARVDTTTDDDRHDTTTTHDPDSSVTPRLRVAVLAGGRSSEHEISLASARSVVAALDPARYEVRTIEIGRDGRWALPPGDVAPRSRETTAETLPGPDGSAPATLGAVDVVLPILHGPFGEDGTVQGLCELAGVAYVGSGVLASALCMDKDLFKAVMRGRGIPVARQRHAPARRPGREPVRLPGVRQAGPARLVGRDLEGARREELEDAVALARRHDEKVLVEEFQPGHGGRGRACSATVAPVASVVGRGRRPTPTGTTSTRSTTRAAWT